MDRGRVVYPLIITAICLATRLAIFTIVRSWDTETAARMVTSDYCSYHQLAVNILQEHRFACTAVQDAECLRTPGYPIFIAMVYALFDQKLSVVLFFHILLDTVSALLLLLVISRAIGPTIGFLTALVYAVDPYLVIFSSSLTSEALFILLCVLGLFLLARAVYLEDQKHTNFSLAGAAVAFGLAALTRPIAVYLPIVIVATTIIRLRSEIGRGLRLSVLFGLVFFATLLPWLVRNYLHFKEFRLSTCDSYNLLFLHAGEAELERVHLPPALVMKNLVYEVDSMITEDGRQPERLSQFEKTHYWNRLASHKIARYPFVNIKHYWLGVFRFFFSVESEYLAEVFRLPGGSRDYVPKSYPEVGSMVKGWFAAKSRPQIVLGLLSGAYLLATYLLLSVGLVVGWKKGGRVFLAMLLSVFIYFVLLTGTAGDARLRLPAIPFYLPFVGLGLAHLLRLNPNHVRADQSQP